MRTVNWELIPIYNSQCIKHNMKRYMLCIYNIPYIPCNIHIYIYIYRYTYYTELYYYCIFECTSTHPSRSFVWGSGGRSWKTAPMEPYWTGRGNMRRLGTSCIWTVAWRVPEKLDVLGHAKRWFGWNGSREIHEMETWERAISKELGKSWFNMRNLLHSFDMFRQSLGLDFHAWIMQLTMDRLALGTRSFSFHQKHQLWIPFPSSYPELFPLATRIHTIPSSIPGMKTLSCRPLDDAEVLPVLFPRRLDSSAADVDTPP